MNAPVARRLVLAAALLAACTAEPPTEPAPRPAAGLAPAASDEVVPGRVLARFRPGANVQAIAQANGLGVGPPVALGILAMGVPAGREHELARRLAANPNVEFAEPDWLRILDDPQCPTCILPGDALFGYKWDLHNDGTINSSTGSELAVTGAVNADIDWLEAFNLLGSGFAGSARVAILDTGVRTTHEDLAGRVVAQRDFVNGDDDASDDQGHGTHVAGIAAAAGGNARGLTGVAYGAGIGIMAGKVCRPTFFGLSAECPSSAIVAAITWAADNGAHVINLSLGGSQASESERQALQYARERNVLPFCAAGNNGTAGVLYPAAFPECVAVSATDWGDDLASYSNWGPEVLLSAPGGDSENASGYSQIASTCYGSDTQYCLKAGTSMATPQAAGLATLLFALGTGTADEVLQRMQDTADDLGASGWDERFGHGRINAYRAVQGLGGGGGGGSGGSSNTPPVADFSASCSGATCGFSDASTDSDGSIVTWAWTFGDGATSPESSPSHTYACSGSYTVTLTVTDDAGASGSTSRVVTASVASPGGSGSIPDLIAWLRADALTGLTNGDPVAAWTDVSGSCHHATQPASAKQPLYQATQAFGQPALFFDAADDGMILPINPGLGVTIVAVYASRAATSGHLLNGSASFFMGPYVGRYRNYTSGYADGPPVEAGRWVVQTLRQRSGRSELYIDGAFQSWTKRNSDPVGLWLAREGTYGKFLDGWVAEVLVFDRTLSDAELQSVHDDLLARYAPAPIPNQPPAASFTSSCSDLACSFADTSTDTDGTIVSRSWAFGDGGTSSSATPSHTYATEGTYHVTLEVTDDDGATATAGADVTVTAPSDGGGGGGGGGGGETDGPGSITGLVLWLKADALTGLADGDPVAAWPDQSGAGADATQSVAGRRPVYGASVVNGLPALFFDGADDGLATPADPNGQVTIFVVYASRVGASGYVLNGASRFFMGPYIGVYRNYTSAYANGPSVTAGRWLVQTLRQSSSLAELFIDGVFEASTKRTTNPRPLQLAAEGTYGKALDGWIAEVLVYDRTLSDAERADVEAWLKAKYALP